MSYLKAVSGLRQRVSSSPVAGTFMWHLGGRQMHYMSEGEKTCEN